MQNTHEKVEQVQVEQVDIVGKVEQVQVEQSNTLFRVPCCIIKCLMGGILVLYWIARTLLWLHFVAQLTCLSISILYRKVKHIFRNKMVSLPFVL